MSVPLFIFTSQLTNSSGLNYHSNMKSKTAVTITPDALRAAASEITDLWWARPDEGGDIKTALVESIFRKYGIEAKKKGGQA